MSFWAVYPFVAARFPGLIPDAFPGWAPSHPMAWGLLAALLGVAWQAAACMRWPGKAAYALAVGVGASIVLFALFAAFGSGRLGWILAGLGLGALAGWPVGAIAARGVGPLRGGWGLAVFVAVCLALLPFDFDSTLAQLQMGDWALPERIYQLVKPAILWAGLGAVIGLSGGVAHARVWAIAAVAGFLLVAPFTAGNLTWADTVEVLALLPGLAAGMWLGNQSRQSALVDSPDHVKQDGAVESAKAESASPHASAVTGMPAQASAVQMAGRAVALLLAAGIGLSLFQFPAFQMELAVGLLMYGALLWRFSTLWLVVVPSALALIDLAPWTGRFFWDEFDLLMLVTLAVAMWKGQFRLSVWPVPKLETLLGLLTLCWLVSLLLGLFPLQAWDANAFSAYWSHYNSLRLGKGLLWGLVFYGLYRSQPENSGAFTRLSIGMALGVLGVGLWALWEQVLFAGAATTADYRVTAGFSSMHTGGGHIEAYLAIALPFVWGLFFQLRHPLYRLMLGAVFLLGAYAIFFTVARGGLIALGVALLILMAGTWRARNTHSSHRAGSALPWVMGGLTLVVMVAGVSGVFWQQRLEQTGADAGIRFRHWAEVLDMRDSGVMAALFGQGLGSLPATNLVTQLPDKGGSYRYASEAGNPYLALNSAGILYMAQRVAPHPEENLKLEVSVRAPSTNAGLEASLCEKTLFNSLRCQWLKVDVKTGTRDWQLNTQTFNSGAVGSGNVLTRRPVQFSLYNPTPGTVIEVDNVRLLDAQGQNILRNGDFAQGGDFWFFKSGDHLFWHAKNLWVHLLFEQGWLGVLTFALILMLALVRLARAVVQGAFEATVMLASMGAWVVIGGVDSLVDAPRIALLVYGSLLIGAAWGAVPRVPVKRTRHKRHSHDPERGGVHPVQ